MLYQYVKTSKVLGLLGIKFSSFLAKRVSKVSCVMWHEGLMPQMVLLSFYFALALYGIYNWSKES